MMAKTRPTFDFCSFETIAISTRLEACPFSPPQNAGQPLSPDPAHGLMISPVVFPPCQNPRLPHVAAFQVPVKRIWAPTGLGDGLRDAWASMTHKDIGGADERTAGGHDRVVRHLSSLPGAVLHLAVERIAGLLTSNGKAEIQPLNSGSPTSNARQPSSFRQQH